MISIASNFEAHSAVILALCPQLTALYTHLVMLPLPPPLPPPTVCP
jgi:hypothetical protein